MDEKLPKPPQPAPMEKKTVTLKVADKDFWASVKHGPSEAPASLKTRLDAFWDETTRDSSATHVITIETPGEEPT